MLLYWQEERNRVLGPPTMAHTKNFLDIDTTPPRPCRPRPHDRTGGIHQRAVDIEQHGFDAKTHDHMLANTYQADPRDEHAGRDMARSRCESQEYPVDLNAAW